MKRGRLALLIPVFTLLISGVAGCDNASKHPRFDEDGNYTPYIDDKFIDYAHDGSVKLGLDYQGRDFYTDGIAEVDVLFYIDGDTTHFTQKDQTKSQDTIKARYYGIDTPESTGNVEKWGKEASIFTQQKLEEAKTIVVSTAQETYGAPEFDSTGSRYVSLVWVSDQENCPYDELVLLNLWIVQAGLSWVKNVLSMPEYVDTFYAAQNQAEKYMLCLWDDVTPPHWPGEDYIYVSLYELHQEVVKDLDARKNGETYSSPWDNTRVLIQGTVAGYTNNTIYLVDYYDADFLNDYWNVSTYTEGCWAGINIFAGMSNVRSKYVETNTYLQLYGLFQDSENYGFQITDVAGRFPAATSYSPQDAQIIMTAEENIIPAVDGGHMLDIEEYSPDEFIEICSSANKWDYLNQRVEINDYMLCESVTITDSNNIYLFFDERFGIYTGFNVFVGFSYKGDPDYPNRTFTTEEDFVGSYFMFSGVLTFHITSSGNQVLEVMPNDASDLLWKAGSTTEEEPEPETGDDGGDNDPNDENP